ncbi:purine and uridine phosphorylase [Aspergillus pseudoustus]|uniref:Purine and uridine phosphorylase n=1 Tax=Aspergillus pseudoustus TaxID=1810923 RepID=A0ABR4J405_9EURO
MASRLENAAYTVGWLCTDHINLATARAMLDEEHSRPQTLGHLDDNNYVLGKIGLHNVVIACAPAGVRGTVSASVAATQMVSSFPKIRFGVLVGTGGGIPSDDHDIRLGDVAVSIPHRTFSGVVQFDLGKATPSGFVRTGSLNKPPRALLNAISQVRANREMGENQVPQYLEQLREHFDAMADAYTYQGHAHDRLFPPDYPHSNQKSAACTKCKGVKRRSARKDTSPVIHYGTIASSNKIIEDGLQRDQLAEEFGAICVETEAAGLMDNFPCVVIRGVCNYADAHRKGADGWHRYASATAAAFAKELLQTVHAHDVVDAPLAADIMSG